MDKFHSQEEFELIEAYLNGSFDSQKQEEVRQRISSDEGFAARVREFSEFQLGVERAALSSRLDSFHAEITDERDATPTRKLNTFQLWSIVASYFLIITAGIWWIMEKENPGERLYHAYFVSDPGLVTSMSGEGNYEFDRGMVDYKSGDYSKSLQFWQPLLQQDPHNDTLLYFIALDHLQLENLAEAKELLEQVTMTKESQFSREANWYLGLAMVKEGKFEKAIPYLVASEREEAKSLITELDQ
ncbi:hypothetical protein GCM10009119_03760 [Algoriphagus jejuensis]|uniref:Tetratricopeptide repeat protein n=1 Tax=Algoriphagus jejuensis TaxID=419934 RepID=A0ABP3Y7A0_9BACT